MTWSIDTSGPTHFVTIDGRRMTFAEAVTGYAAVKTSMVRKRLQNGMGVQEAFLTPSSKASQDWRRITKTAKTQSIKHYAASGMTPAEVAEKFRNATLEDIVIFADQQKINFGASRRRKAERPPANSGERMWGKEIDPRTEPGLQGVPFLQTNEHTCRWPMWDEPQGPASDRMCCGQHTNGASHYCEHHDSIGKMKAPKVKEVIGE